MESNDEVGWENVFNWGVFEGKISKLVTVFLYDEWTSFLFSVYITVIFTSVLEDN